MSDTYRRSDSPVLPGITLTKILVVINAAVFVILTVRGNTQNTEYMFQNGALWVPSVLQDGEYWRLVTSVFMHFSLTHLFNNMLLLFFMGDVLEEAVGKIRFLLIYLGSGIAGNVITVIAEQRSADYSLSAGASGAVFGVLGALLGLLIINHGQVAYLTGGRMVFYVAYSLFAGFTSSGINNAAHLGGLAAGFILVFFAVLTIRR